MRKVALLGAVFAALLAMASTAAAQTASGQITGTVKDSTGAVVPGVAVTVANELTGAKTDPCVLYAFRCATYYARGGREPELLKWWNWKNRKP